MKTPTYLKNSAAAAMLLLAPTLAFGLATPWVEQPHIQVRLLSSKNEIGNENNMIIGWELKPEEGWHVYWQNPGDSGMPPSIELQSQYITRQTIRWPYPHKIPYGPLLNYGYQHVVLPVDVELKPRTNPSALTLEARTSWLVCKEFCIPGKALLSMQIPQASSGGKPVHAKIIQSFIDKVPKPLPLMGSQVEENGDTITLALYASTPLFNNATHVEFFPVNEQFVEAASPPQLQWKNNYLQITQKRSSDYSGMPKNISGVIVINHQQALQFSIEPVDITP